MEGVYIRNINKLAVGHNVYFGVNSFVQAAGGVSIGDYVLVGPGTKIWSANHRYDDLDKPIIEQGYDFKKVTIGNNVWIGANVFVMPGAQIGDGVVISAGSVVGGKAYPPNAILAGNPARRIGERTIPPQ
jgi:acetyltransferase-like isoleucine patch superfamily enzyme